MNDIVHQLRQASLNNEDYRWKAADEITNIRSTNSSLLDILDSRNDQLYELQVEVKRLHDENFSLAAWQCESTDGKTGLVASEGGNTYCAMAKEVERLRQKKSYWPDNAERDAVIKHQQQVIERLVEKMRVAGFQNEEIRVFLEPRE